MRFVIRSVTIEARPRRSGTGPDSQCLGGGLVVAGLDGRIDSSILNHDLLGRDLGDRRHWCRSGSRAGVLPHAVKAALHVGDPGGREDEVRQH